ncbi:MAG: TetR/AcrR family transcriptional regulator [Deltaproteobacteria bacterium]|nr:TetR/AcrR family transcriptional regulator [Deltaproteobacteria bacterium]
MSMDSDIAEAHGEPTSGDPARAGRGSDRARERRERTQARARHDILEAALRAFAASGFGDTKMADIAAEAGYTAASLYTYFASKQDIIRALAEHLVEEIAAAWGPALEPPAEPVDFVTFAERFRERVRGVLAHIDQRKEGLAFFFKLRWSSDPDLPPITDGCARHERLEMRIRERLEAVLVGIGLRHVSGLEPDTISSAFGGLIETLLIRALATERMPSFVDEADRFTDFLLYGIRGPR